jgi:hypothetical protein
VPFFKTGKELRERLNNADIPEHKLLAAEAGDEDGDDDND